MQVAKSASVNERVKLFETQRPPSVDQHTDLDREIKAAAIKREIEEAKAAQKRELEVRKREEKLQKRIMGLSTSSSSENVEMQSPIESKVKPLKIPMKPKIIGPASPTSPQQQQQQQNQNPEQRGVPGTRLRINQPAGQEIKSILRTNKSSTNNSLSVEEQVAKRLSIENLPSIKSKIETYEEGKPNPAEPPQQQGRYSVLCRE